MQEPIQQILNLACLLMVISIGNGGSNTYGRLVMYGNRHTGGADFTSTSFMLRYEVDATNFQFTSFNASGVGIGATNPSVPLHIGGSGGSGSPIRLVSNAGGSEVAIGFYRNPDQSIPTTGDLWVMGVMPWGVGDRNFGIGCNGTTSILNIISSGTIYFSRYTTNGTLSVTSGAGLVSSSSDRRIKENIEYLSDTQQGLASILNLKPATFSLIGSSGTYLGFIAQDLEQEIPLAVDGKKYEWQWEEEDGKPKFDANGDIVYKLDADGNRMIRPRGLQDRAIIATQTLAIQELAKQNAALKQKLDFLLAWAQTQGYSG